MFTAPPDLLTRPDLRGTFGMCATTHWVASATAQAVLERGGNAFDAAVAAGFVLHLVEPHLNGPGGDMNAIVAAADDARAVVGLTDGRVVALDLTTGAPAWTWAGGDAVVGAPLVSGGTVYVGTTGRHVVALDAATGAETFRADVRGRVKSGLVAAGGRLVVLSEPRHAIAFDAAPRP